jgi:hypothetical protein
MRHQPELRMNFDEFRQRARLYVLGVLETSEIEEFEASTKEFGQKASDCLRECYALHEALALSLRPAKSSAALKERLMSMVRERQQPRGCRGVESPCRFITIL